MRVRFAKEGPMVYIGHLDLAKFMIRQLVRSGLPVWYTEGFNPRPHLVFASSLSVGCGGEREIMDFRLAGEASDAEIFEKLAPLMPDGMRIIEVFTAEHKLKEIEWGEYEIAYSSSRPGIAEEVNELFKSPVIMMKRSKSGEHETDITQYIGTLEVSERDGALTVVFTANAADGRYLNPVYIAKAIAEKLGFNEPYSVMRKKLMLSDGTEMR